MQFHGSFKAMEHRMAKTVQDGMDYGIVCWFFVFNISNNEGLFLVSR